ncbi:hypothetical protein CABS01_13672, partial [Colletotrichum abscissum]|uniref:uncharacterized protein n=1 Tax=Colletotrichum abscissum TaxID=1671311 RepID=UPI0027D53604
PSIAQIGYSELVFSLTRSDVQTSSPDINKSPSRFEVARFEKGPISQGTQPVNRQTPNSKPCPLQLRKTSCSSRRTLGGFYF